MTLMTKTVMLTAITTMDKRVMMTGTDDANYDDVTMIDDTKVFSCQPLSNLIVRYCT